MSHHSGPMGPFAQAEGHDTPGLIGEHVPSGAAVVKDIVVRGEDPVRQPVVAQELPDVFHGIQLGCLSWERHEGDVVGDNQPLRLVPSGLVEQDDRVSAGRDGLRDLGQVQGHGVCRAARQDQPSALALGRANGAKDVGGRRPLVLGR